MNRTRSTPTSSALRARRAFVGSLGGAAAGVLLTGAGHAQASPAADRSPVPVADIPLEIYRGFSLNQLERWDRVIHPQVKANSPAGRDIQGLATLKKFNQAFLDAFRPGTDLVDHFVAGDRGLVVVNLHWVHDGGPFNGIPPTGKRGTSIESFQLRIEDGMVVRWDVADNSLDLANYLHDQGMKLPTFVEPPPLIEGVALPTRRR